MIKGNIDHTRSSNSRQRNKQSDCVDRLLRQGLIDPATSFLSRRGKGLRASLMVHCFRIAGGVGQLPANAIAAIEMLHAGSLIIDDIEDRSDTRRGEPTLHKQVGLPLALNTGNWMYFRALEALGELATDFPQVDGLMRRTISTVRQCHEGQALDLVSKIHQLQLSDVRPTVEAISQRKTAALTALAARVAATIAGAADSNTEVMALFGADLGLCLQMRNDLEELRQARFDGGRCDDLLQGRVTWPWAWYADRCGHRQFEEMQSRAIDAQSESLSARNLAATLYSNTKHIAESEIERQFQRGFSRLTTVFDAPQSISGLSQALHSIASRRQSSRTQ